MPDPRPTILVADDDEHLLEALTVRLTAEGFSVTPTHDGYQALALAKRTRPDLLLLDIGLPAGDGFSVFERLRRCEEQIEIPVIYMTGQSPGAIDEAGLEHGARAMIHKPFETEALLDAVRAALGFWVY